MAHGYRLDLPASDSDAGAFPSFPWAAVYDSLLGRRWVEPARGVPDDDLVRRTWRARAQHGGCAVQGATFRLPDTGLRRPDQRAAAGPYHSPSIRTIHSPSHRAVHSPSLDELLDAIRSPSLRATHSTAAAPPRFPEKSSARSEIRHVRLLSFCRPLQLCSRGYPTSRGWSADRVRSTNETFGQRDFQRDFRPGVRIARGAHRAPGPLPQNNHSNSAGC